MNNNQHHFISYSQAEATDFAVKLHDFLTSGGMSIWLDKRDMKPMISWDSQLEKAIDLCRTLIFVMTPDSVEQQSVCTLEWKRALNSQKPIIPILRDKKARMPFLLEGRQYIDFSEDTRFDNSLASLRVMMNWLESDEGYLHSLEEHLAHLRRISRRVQDVEVDKVNQDIKDTEAKIQELKRPPEGQTSAMPTNTKPATQQSKLVENNLSGPVPQFMKLSKKISDECIEEFLAKSIFGIPPSESQYTSDVFMLMPFTDKLRPIYSDIIRPLMDDKRLIIKRGDDFFSRNSIMVMFGEHCIQPALLLQIVQIGTLTFFTN